MKTRKTETKQEKTQLKLNFEQSSSKPEPKTINLKSNQTFYQKSITELILNNTHSF
jgi:hypothetical protein